ncbi:MAG TPA: L-serine ammonia-lyase [Holophagaceae bacterium]|jgi:L-serine dehydratase|nr:L-serine ammonia-lyase [Holophagaceae bacterium]
MAISVFDLFKIGIGPSSSHTVGPMKAARGFVERLQADGLLDRAAHVKAELFGSLGLTGKGHGSDKAVILGLMGETPDRVPIEAVEGLMAKVRDEKKLMLMGTHAIPFVEGEDLVLHKRRSLPFHPNGMRFTAWDADGAELRSGVFYSVGGGFVVDEAAAQGEDPIKADDIALPCAFHSGDELMAICAAKGWSMSRVMLENEKAWRSEAEIRSGLLRIWSVMQACVQRGCETEGILPGGLHVPRRAHALYARLKSRPEAALCDPLTVLDWVNLYALSVNEENAAGGRVVTAPTNGAAGIIPAVAHYYWRFTPSANEDGIVRFLLTAGAIGVLYKENASISGAEVGCQGEVGSACSMAAGALCEVLGGTPEQVENAAEIGMEHNLGLTCDPIGGLVQVPCIERNAMAAIKAINAARMAMAGDGKHFVSLDKVIKTMRDTGRDMKDKYKETARGGLAVNVLEVPNLSVNLPEC